MPFPLRVTPFRRLHRGSLISLYCFFSFFYFFDPHSLLRPSFDSRKQTNHSSGENLFHLCSCHYYYLDPSGTAKPPALCCCPHGPDTLLLWLIRENTTSVVCLLREFHADNAFCMDETFDDTPESLMYNPYSRTLWSIPHLRYVDFKENQKQVPS